MEKRYQVFVSSTYEDLKPERNKVITALLSLGHIPCGMEYFPAADEDAWHCIERLIPQCDYYVLLLAGRYGSIPTGEAISYTEKEYDLAVASGVPVLSLLNGQPDDLPKRQCESDKKIQAKLDRFRTKAKKRLCRFWKTADQIPGELLASLAHQIDRKPRVGWVRADTLASEEAKSEIIAIRKKLDKAEARVTKFEQTHVDQEGELASGSDDLRLAGTILNYTPDPWFSSGEPSVQLKARFELTSTWNRLLRVLAGQKKKTFSSDDLKRWIMGAISGVIESESIQPARGEWDRVSVEIDHQEISKVITQFCAINLIAHRNSYPDWGFTQKGLYHGSRQHALKKGELYAGDAPWCEVVIGEPEEVISKARVPAEEW